MSITKVTSEKFSARRWNYSPRDSSSPLSRDLLLPSFGGMKIITDGGLSSSIYMSSEVSFVDLPLESVASGILIAALGLGSWRIAMRLFNEANSALAYLHKHCMSVVQ